MNKNLKIKKLTPFILVLIFFIALPATVHAATLYFSPSSGSYKIGATLPVSVYVSSADQAINAVSGVISFPTDKLEVTSLSKTGSIFSSLVREPSFLNSDGTVNFEGIVLNPGFTGASGKVITINFIVKTGGLIKLDFSSGLALANDGQGTNILTDRNSAQFEVISTVLLNNYFGSGLDSDNDGIPDQKETSIYFTNPKNADTDGDGFQDGSEVLSGYDPTVKGQKININFSKKYQGRILLQTQEHGEAWYINPANIRRYYMGRPTDAFSLMRTLGVGITNVDLEKIPVGLENLGGIDTDNDGLSDMIEDSLGTDKDNNDSDGDGYNDKAEIVSGYNPRGSGKLSVDNNFVNNQKGKILLQVQSNGEAWYVNPVDGKRYFLGRPTDAFNLMRKIGFGVSFRDLVKIKK